MHAHSAHHADPQSRIARHAGALLRAASLRVASRVLGGIAGRVVAADAALPPTPANAEGPFYPAQKPADSDADLTQVAGTRAARRRARSCT